MGLRKHFRWEKEKQLHKKTANACELARAGLALTGRGKILKDLFTQKRLNTPAESTGGRLPSMLVHPLLSVIVIKMYQHKIPGTLCTEQAPPFKAFGSTCRLLKVSLRTPLTTPPAPPCRAAAFPRGCLLQSRATGARSPTTSPRCPLLPLAGTSPATRKAPERPPARHGSGAKGQIPFLGSGRDWPPRAAPLTAGDPQARLWRHPVASAPRCRAGSGRSGVRNVRREGLSVAAVSFSVNLWAARPPAEGSGHRFSVSPHCLTSGSPCAPNAPIPCQCGEKTQVQEGSAKEVVCIASCSIAQTAPAGNTSLTRGIVTLSRTK